MKKQKRPAKAASTKGKRQCAKKRVKSKKLVRPRKTPTKKGAPARSKPSTDESPIEHEPVGEVLSARQEKFCQIYILGTTAVEAYRAVYGEVKGADQSASRLLSNAKVSERVKALQQRAAHTATLTLAHKREFLYRVVTTPIGEVDEHSDLCQSYERNEMGGTRGKLKRGQADEGNEEDEPEYEVVKTKMPDKLRAIELDAKLAGELIDKHEHEHSADDGLLELLGAIRAGK